MSASDTYSTTVQVESAGNGAPSPAAASDNLLEVSGPLVGLTWVTFIILAVVLYKVAWKPILNALDLRENAIRKALEGAEKARAETAAAEERQRQMIRDAEARSRQTIDEARAAATQAARAIEEKASAEARALLEDARREIGAAAEKARNELRQESAKLAIELAGRMVEEDMDAARNQRLVERLVKEI
jgi:F-type H+-transporting ATPase subunit b